jgi:hypothetical protein
MIKCLFAITSATLLCCQGQEKSDTDALVKQLLAEDLGTRSFLFSQVVESSSGKKVLPFSKENPIHNAVLTEIKSAVEIAIVTLNKPDSPIMKLRRINEASRYFEDIILAEIDRHPKLSCTIPKNKQGKAQRSGYPDMRIEHTSRK